MMVFPGCTSVTYFAKKCDDIVLTSAAPGVLRLEIRLTRQRVSNWRFYFLGLEDDVGHVVPLMTTIPGYLTGS